MTMTIDFEVTTEFWDCECEYDFIHDKRVGNYCPKCKSHEEDQPDSRVNELFLYTRKKDKAIRK